MSGVDVEGAVYNALADRTSDLVWLEEASAHVAAVLREQIGAAMAEAWDEGFYDGLAQAQMPPSRPITPNPYRAAQVATSRVPGEET